MRYRVKIISSALTMSALSLAGAGLAQDAKMDDLMARRIQSAQELVVQGRAVTDESKKIHESFQQLIAQATKLKGEAQMLNSSVPLSGGVKMNAIQLKAAQNQYNLHLAQFAAHADSYQAHLNQFKTTVGECHANEAAFQTFAKQVALHVDQFHMPMGTIRPPHVCGVMALTRSETITAANVIHEDEMRVARSEADLAAEENRLGANREMSGALDSKVTSAAIRAEREKEIYGEFGRLRAEYGMLQTEKDVIASSSKGAGGKLTTASVSGKIKN